MSHLPWMTRVELYVSRRDGVTTAEAAKWLVAPEKGTGESLDLLVQQGKAEQRDGRYYPVNYLC